MQCSRTSHQSFAFAICQVPSALSVADEHSVTVRQHVGTSVIVNVPSLRRTNLLEDVEGYWAVAFASPDAGWLVGTEGRILKVSF